MKVLVYRVLTNFQLFDCVLDHLLWIYYMKHDDMMAQIVKNLPAMQKTPVRFLGQEDLLKEGIGYPLQCSWASLVAQTVKNPLAMRETWVPSLGWEDPLEEGMTTQN